MVPIVICQFFPFDRSFECGVCVVAVAVVVFVFAVACIIIDLFWFHFVI